ncbi:MAG: MFS transporter [Burkholderiales bacterium]|nr:MFS transporter [Burkholderiales bacterium]
MRTIESPAAAAGAGASASAAAAAKRPQAAGGTAFKVLGAISASHLLNDMIQSLMLAAYPIFKGNLQLSFVQLGFVTLAYQLTASLFQPVVGRYTDSRPQPYSLPVAMVFSLVGLLCLSQARTFAALLVAAMLVGTGSSIFHPESSRVARLASGGRHGLAQSIFQVGGNTGSAIGPLLAALIIVPHGQSSIAWFALAAVLATLLLTGVGRWYAGHLVRQRGRQAAAPASDLSRGRVAVTVGLLLVLIFSKYFYLASINNYYTFYLIEKFHLDVPAAQLQLFIFLAAVAAGTLLGGPLGDRIGRKAVIWLSILGVAPFTLALPHVGLGWTTVLSVVIGFVLSSAFSAILVYAQELIPGRIGMVSGLFFGFAFGMSGIGAAALGWLADREGVETVYRICAYLPLLGIVAAWLPSHRPARTSS